MIGKTSAGGETIEERPVPVPDLLATVCLALGIDPLKSTCPHRPSHLPCGQSREAD